MADLESLDDVPAPAANAALVRDALNTTYENRVVIPVDITGADGLMLVGYYAPGQQAQLMAMIPTQASVNATDAGRMWVANGGFYEDKLVKVVLIGSGPPSSGDGWDGAYWLDVNTQKEYGPKGTDADGSANPGVWDTTNEAIGRVTKAAIATLPWITGALLTAEEVATPGGATTAGTTQILATANLDTNGTWASATANGHPVPEDGVYEIAGRMSGYGSAAGTRLRLRVMVNGTAVTAPTCVALTSAGLLEYQNPNLKYGPIALSAGDEVGIELEVLVGNAITNDNGYFSIIRVA